MSDSSLPVSVNLPVSVAYALPEQQWVVELEVPQGATVADALLAIADIAPLAGLDVQALPVGIYGERVESTTVLQAHDRVELYRPLQRDPKAARRQRAAESAAGDASSAAGAAAGSASSDAEAGK